MIRRFFCMLVIALPLLFYVEASGHVLTTLTSSPNDTPNIAEGDTAVYNCSSNHSSVVINWFFNTTTPDSSLTSLGVTITGAGTSFSSLSVPGLVYPFNNTNVSCFASGPVAGIVNPPPVILRVQGPPGAVVDKSINFSCTYYISWTAPFTLSGFPILQYNINVTNGTAVIYKTNVTVTEWSYSPVEFGNHSVTIAAVNSVGEGERSTINQKTDRYTITNVTCADRYRDSINWIIVLHIEVSTVTDWLECIDIVTVTCVDTAVSVNTSNITVTATGLVIATLNTSLLDDKYHTFTTDLSHSNGLQVNYNKPLRLSFFDVSNFSILSIESNTVTFMCDFVRGSQAIGCHISLNDSLLNTTYSINITREIRTGSLSVPAGNYSISVFDINEDNGLISASAVFTSNVVIITATGNISSPVIMPSPTPLMSQLPEEERNAQSDSTVIIIAAVVGVVAAIGCALLIVIVAGVIVYRRKRKIWTDTRTRPVELQGVTEKSEMNAHTHAEVIMAAVETGETSLAAPLPQDTNVQYNEVFVQNPTAEIYSVVSHPHPPHQPAANEESNGEEVMYVVLQRDTKPAHTHTVPTEGYSTLPAFVCSSNYSSISKPDKPPEIVITNKTELTHTDLKALVVPHLTHKWYEVGEALAITPDNLEDIRENHQGITDIFILWQDEATRPFTWETLIMVLKSHIVNETQLAEQLETALYQ